MADRLGPRERTRRNRRLDRQYSFGLSIEWTRTPRSRLLLLGRRPELPELLDASHVLPDAAKGHRSFHLYNRELRVGADLPQRVSVFESTRRNVGQGSLLDHQLSWILAKRVDDEI